MIVAFFRRSQEQITITYRFCAMCGTLCTRRLHEYHQHQERMHPIGPQCQEASTRDYEGRQVRFFLLI